MTASAFAALLRLRGVARECGGNLKVVRWDFDPQPTDLAQLAVEVGQSYVTTPAALATPGARLGSKVPTSETVIAGDFGEIVARAIYRYQVGTEVPFSKLRTMKPVADATVQGPDVLCLTLTPGELPEPVTVEAKTRTGGGPAAVLGSIGTSTQHQDVDYLISAWAAGAESMLAHPDHRRHFALAAAQHLGRLTDPEAKLPPHAAHAVAIVGTDKITSAKLTEHWGTAPPVSELHIVNVPDLELRRNEVFDLARTLTYADLSAGATRLLEASRHTAGVSGLISPQAAIDLAATSRSTDLLVVVEATLWFLADHDGVGLARARHAAASENPVARGLAQLLTGAVGTSLGTLKGHPLLPFAETASGIMKLDRMPPDLVHAAEAVARLDGVTDDVAHAAKHVAAAVLHRLDRHPVTLTRTAGATGPLVEHVVAELLKYGRYALWPSQAAAVQGALLDPKQGSLAIKMPTSAGKTTLMQLLIADQLDKTPSAGVAVLAPNRALVGQLQRDIRESLPTNIEVRASRGGLDYDTESPSTVATLTGAGVMVVTPERFDLDWRRAATGDGGVELDALKLIVVDEAQLIESGTRGAALERVIARALRTNMRVVLISSQFSDVSAIATWINGDALESDWQPAWLERLVYLRGPEGIKHSRALTGYLWSEGGALEPVLTLKPSERSKGAGCVRDRRHETAALVRRYADDGLVVVYTDRKDRAQALLEVITTHLPPAAHVPPELEQLAASIEEEHPKEAAALRAGLGLHHADVPEVVKRAIEGAARRRGGLLRCIVCTSTLLEGVDFPARTVIAAYPPQDRQGQPQIARIRNLAGRAGRGGNFTSGRLVVMTNDHSQARKWRRALRTELPVTETALTQALKELRRRQPESLEDPGILGALTIEVLAEAAASDGDLRLALETALEQTMWFSTTAPEAREPIMQAATRYAQQIAAVIPDAMQRNAFYRSGLSLASCIALRERLADELGPVTHLLTTPNASDADLENVLHWLIGQLVAALDELAPLRSIDAAELRTVLTMWMAGESEAVIEAARGDAWRSVKHAHLETLLPWALTGSFEVWAALAGDVDLRDLAHRRLKPARLRYGVPHPELFELVQRGIDRVAVARVAQQVRAEHEEQMNASPQSIKWLLWDLADAVRDRLAEEALASEFDGSLEGEDLAVRRPGGEGSD